MKIYTLSRTQKLPISLGEAWAFFSTPANLSRITPGDLTFDMVYKSGGDTMYAGQLIRYKIGIFPMIKTSWVTEITHVDAPHYFVDEQRFGPYALWHHQHRFREIEGGVEMTDEVNYAIPLGWLGQLAHVLFVRRQVNAIFDYRFDVIEKIFSKEKQTVLV